MLVLVAHPFDINQARLALLSCNIEFTLSWRQSCRIFPAVFVCEQTQVNIAVMDFLKIDFVSPPVGSRQVLEQKDIEEFSKQWISANVIAQANTHRRKFLLHTAQKDATPIHTSRILPVSSSCIIPCLICRALASFVSSMAISVSISDKVVAIASCSARVGTAY